MSFWTLLLLFLAHLLKKTFSYFTFESCWSTWFLVFYHFLQIVSAWTEKPFLLDFFWIVLAKANRLIPWRLVIVIGYIDCTYDSIFTISLLNIFHRTDYVIITARTKKLILNTWNKASPLILIDNPMKFFVIWCVLVFWTVERMSVHIFQLIKTVIRTRSWCWTLNFSWWETRCFCWKTVISFLFIIFVVALIFGLWVWILFWVKWTIILLYALHMLFSNFSFKFLHKFFLVYNFITSRACFISFLITLSFYSIKLL